MAMKMKLAIALDCSPTECKALLLDSGAVILTEYSARVLARLSTQPGMLVAVDLNPVMPQVVYRWHSGKVRELKGGMIVVDDQHCHLIEAYCAPGLVVVPQVDDWVFLTRGYSQQWEVADIAIDGRPVHSEYLSNYAFPKIAQLYTEPFPPAPR